MSLVQHRTPLDHALPAVWFYSCVLTACPPHYPKCDKDEHCKENEFCVNGMCQQCRDTKDCPEGQVCNKGRCEPDPGLLQDQRTTAPTERPARTIAAWPASPTRTAARATAAAMASACARASALTDDDCPENHECQNGVCVAPPPVHT